MSGRHNLLREEDNDSGIYDREKSYDDAPPRRFKFLYHHLRRRRLFLVVAVILIVAIIIVAAVPTYNKTSGGGGKEQPYVPYTDIRLPEWIIPQEYNLSIDTHFETSTFNGTVNITLQLTQSTNIIPIHAVGFRNLTNVQLAALGSTNILMPDKTYPANETLQYVVYHFDKLSGLKFPATVWLSIEFVGDLTNSLAGYYLSSYNESGTAYNLATTQFEPTDARRAFPCFDEPAKKANFTITMGASKEYQAISNMPVKSTSGDNFRYTSFETSVKMSTYLVCFIVHQFASRSTTLTIDNVDIPITIYTTPGTVSQSQYALTVTKDVLNYYNDFFNISYPLPKMDVVAIPDFAAGAMENWGIITFRQTALLFDEATGSAADRQRVADVVAHELAHQWFGNLVTMEWWSDIFLNEGFATYMEYYSLGIGLAGVGQDFAGWNFMSQFQINEHEPAMARDALVSTHPILNTAQTPTQINAAFDTITYEKGASVIFMLDSLVGGQEFRTTIHNYLTHYAYSNAEADDLWAYFNNTLLENRAFKNVTALMNSWVTQKGFPYVIVDDSNPANITLTQKIFHLDSNTTDGADQTWLIPINAASKSHNYTWDLVTRTASYTPTPALATGEYIILNTDGSGFFRTLYNTSSPNYAKLINDLPTINSATKAILYDDAFNFLQANMIDAATVLNMTTKLKTERDYSVWVTALSGLSFINSKIKIAPCYGAYQTYVQSLINDTVTYVGWESTADEHMKNLMRSTILLNAASYGLPSVINYTLSLWSTNTTISPDLRNTAYRMIAAYGGEQGFDWLIKRYTDPTTSAAEQVSCLQALGSAREPYLIIKALDFALNKVRPQDAYTVFAYAARNPIGYEFTWDYFRENFAIFQEENRGLSSFIDNIMLSIAASFTSDIKLQEMEDFLATTSVKDDPFVPQAFESVKINIQWVEKNANDICTWLNANH